MWKLIDRLPLGALVVVALFLGSAPISPEPHLVEKLRMLAGGTLTRPLDIFDLLMHSAPLLLLLVKLVRLRALARAARTAPEPPG